jgi:Kef-type K+ transport system membrane component KefB
MSERDRPSGFLTQGLETSPEGARQLNRYGYLYALLGLVAVFVIGGMLLLWLA